MKSLSSVQGAAETSKSEHGDYRISDIAKIMGVSYSTAASHSYHKEYRLGKTRLVQRAEFDYRRNTGQSVSV